jgi:hypothetical protein
MADIGRLLLPPPSIVTGRSSLVRTPDVRGGDGKGGDAARDDQGQVTRVDETPDATSGGRAKQFRFRVVDGGRSDQLAGNAEVPARTTGRTGRTPETEDETAAIRGTQAANARGPQGNAVPLGTPQAAFLAQLIAQEQLAPGLYDPPVKAADRAYRQAGGEPALEGAARSTPRYQIAV